MSIENLLLVSTCSFWIWERKMPLCMCTFQLENSIQVTNSTAEIKIHFWLVTATNQRNNAQQIYQPHAKLMESISLWANSDGTTLPHAPFIAHAIQLTCLEFLTLKLSQETCFRFLQLWEVRWHTCTFLTLSHNLCHRRVESWLVA